MPPFKIFISFLDALPRPGCFEALLKIWANSHSVDVNHEVGRGSACWPTLLEKSQYRGISAVDVFKETAPLLQDLWMGPVDGNNLATTLVCHKVFKIQWVHMAQLLHPFLSWHIPLFSIHNFSGRYSGSCCILRWNVHIEDLKEVAQNTVSKFGVSLSIRFTSAHGGSAPHTVEPHQICLKCSCFPFLKIWLAGSAQKPNTHLH